MTRFAAFLLGMFWFGASLAQSLTSDAFGLYVGEDPARATWSGTAVACDAQGCKFDDFEPGEAFQIDHFFGQKSLVVERDHAMSLSLVTDRYGNLVRQGALTAQAEDGEIRENTDIKHGLGAVVFHAGSRAARYFASSFSRDRQSLVELYRTIPETVSINPELAPLAQDIRQGNLVEIETAPLLDQYRNRAPVGFLISGFTRGQDGRFGFFPLTAQDEMARFTLPTNNLNGAYDIWLETGHKKGTAQALLIEPSRVVAVRGIEAEFSPETRLLSFRLSSILTTQHHLIDDATQLGLVLVEANGRVHEDRLWTLEGAVAGRVALHPDAFPLSLTLGDAASHIRLVIEESDLEVKP